MATLRDVARIRNINAPASNLPDGDSSEKLKAASELVYRMVTTKLTEQSPLRSHDGVPGKMWQGRILSDVIYELWPNLNDRMYIEKALASELIDKILNYLKDCKVMRCKQPSSQYNPAVWWVADHWTPMDTRSVEDAPTPEPVEVDAPAVAAEDAGGVLCRACEGAFATTVARGAHEFRAHRIAVSDEGTVYSYNDSTFTVAYREQVVLRALDVLSVRAPFATLNNAAHAIDPRMGRTKTIAALTALAERGLIAETRRGLYPLYALASNTSQEPVATDTEESTPAPEQRPVEAKPAPIARKLAPPMDRDLSARIGVIDAQLTEGFDALGRVRTSARLLVSEARRLENKLVETEQELTAIKINIVAKATPGRDAQNELDELREQVKSLTADRDDYKSKLENWQRALQGLGAVK